MAGTAAGLMAVAAVVAGCVDEDPTGVGAGLLGPGVQTYEVLLDAADFLVADTTFDRIGSLNDAVFDLVAHEFEGAMEAHTIFRVNRPFLVTWTDTADVQRTDSIAAIVGGTLIVVVDTVATTPTPVSLELRAATERWHRASASWTIREDTAAAPLSWTTPGGSPGAVMATGVWEEGDTVRIPVDSASVAVWHDTAQARIGGVLRTTTPGARMRIRSVQFRFDVVPVDADTVVVAGTAGESKILVTPESAAAPESDELRVGGLPAWRSMIRFRPLTGVEIPCAPGSPPECRVALGDVRINLATLLLAPVPAGARRVEHPIRVDGRGVLVTPHVPLARSPLTTPIGLPSDSILPALFTGTQPDPPPARVPVTFFVNRNAVVPAGETRWDWLALTQIGERTSFGYARFGGVLSDRPPRLRLVVSTPVGELVQ